MLPWVHRFSELGKEAAASVKVSKAWFDGTMAYAPYVEMRDCEPYMVFRAHQGQVDSMALVVMPGTNQRVLFTGGDRRVLASDIDKGEVITLITRDSGEIPLLFEQEFKLITASSNGSIRMFDLSHVLDRTKLSRTVWEHSRFIRGMLMAEPSEGYCKLHGVENHVCEFYTASEDRRIIVWDQQSSNPIRSIESKTIRHHSFISLGQTRRHLIAGTSDASLFVFSKLDECERSDVHACSTPGAKKVGCLQVALRLPNSIQTSSGAPPMVLSILTCRTDKNYVYGDIDDYDPDNPHEGKDPNYANMRLYAGDITGQLTVWAVPEFYGLDYLPVLTKKMHDGPISVIERTTNHVVTLGDDGIIILLDISSLWKVRKMDLLAAAAHRGFSESPRVKRKLKSIEIHHDADGSGTMIVGTSFGDVYVMSLGYTV
jgi:WD40 repeat protein